MTPTTSPTTANPKSPTLTEPPTDLSDLDGTIGALTKAPRPDPNPANPANPPMDLLERAGELDDEQLARLFEYVLRERRHRLGNRLAAGGAHRTDLVAELAWWQRVDTQMQIHMNDVACSVYAGRHPKHWLWREHKRFILDRAEPGWRVLDVGCGASAYLLWLAELGCSVTGWDINPDRVAQAQQIMAHPSLRFEVRDVMASPPDEPFDLAVCSHVIEHLDEPVAMLDSLRACAPRLIVAVPPDANRWQKVMFRELGLPWKDDEDHRREYSPALLGEQVERAGWIIDELVEGVDLKVLAHRSG